MLGYQKLRFEDTPMIKPLRKKKLVPVKVFVFHECQTCASLGDNMRHNSNESEAVLMNRWPE